MSVAPGGRGCRLAGRALIAVAAAGRACVARAGAGALAVAARLLAGGGPARDGDRGERPDAGQIRAALASAARTMTTLDVNIGQLRTAVAPYPVVKACGSPPSSRTGCGSSDRAVPVAAIVAGGAVDRRRRRRHAAPRRRRTASLPDDPARGRPRAGRRLDRPRALQRAGAARGRALPAARADQPGHDEPAARARGRSSAAARASTSATPASSRRSGRAATAVLADPARRARPTSTSPTRPPAAGVGAAGCSAGAAALDRGGAGATRLPSRGRHGSPQRGDRQSATSLDRHAGRLTLNSRFRVRNSATLGRSSRVRRSATTLRLGRDR